VVSGNVLGLSKRGFSLTELMVVMAIISVVTVTATPFLITYWRAATAKAAAQELAAGLNRGRHLAIAQNQSVCVEVVGIQYRYRIGGCGGVIWIGPGAGANGFFTLANNVTLATNANPVFDYLGAAGGAALTVTNPLGGATLNVVVSVSGRVRICPVGGCAL
jgi:prepilin-type N-terminal cleavage/methylation domain-containing protein